MEEIYKDIPNWVGFYQVSNLGNVISLPRKFSPRKTILKPTITYDGYLKVHLRNGRNGVQVEINRLVALSFIDKDYVSKKLYCDHIDRDRTNNNLDNLRLVSARVNTANNGRNFLTGAYKHGTKWQSAININGKQHFLGTYGTENEAHKAYTLATTNLEKELENELNLSKR